jgi:hypothetical protein
MRTRLIIRTALAIAAVATLGACASINERAWANGQAMSGSHAYSRAMSGDMSMKNVSRLYTAANPRFMNWRETAYPAFPKNGDWWW